MIWLLNTQRHRMSSYNTFEELCDYFNRLEDLKPFINAHRGYGQRGEEDDNCPEFQKHWGFIYHFHHKLPGLLVHLEEVAYIQIVQEAYEKEIDLIEIFRGEGVSEWIMISSAHNEDDFMREWCLDYAYAHGFVFLETISRDIGSSSGQ